MSLADRERAHLAWRRVEKIKILSDKLVSIGPFSIGLDGISAWLPVGNLAFGLTTAALLLWEARAAQVRGRTWMWMVAALAFDNLTDAVPVIGWTIDTLFPGQLLAAKALQRDVEARHGLPPELTDGPRPVRGKVRFKGGA